MVNVRALPSDLARLVLDYLYSEGLQETYDVFLQESPHLEEMRNFPAMGILPLGAKSLQVIVEEYYELMSQDTSKVKNANDALYKLWKRFDSLLVQIKHHYKGSGNITMLSSELASQSVRSRYSLNRLHHERMQLERENALRHVNSIGPVPQQHLQSLQQQQQQLHPFLQTKQKREPSNSPFRRPFRHDIEPDTQPQMVHSPFPDNGGGREGSSRCSTPRSRSPMVQEALSTSPSQSVTSTQTQFVTPTKTQQDGRHVGGEKVVGKSPKRKSAPPRRKAHTGASLERVITSAPSTSGGVTHGEEIPDLPSPWGSLCNNQELVEKLAENINKVLPIQEVNCQEESPGHSIPQDQANISQGTEESQQSGSNSQVLDDLLSGTVSDSMMDEFVDMTSGDPTFNSLFALFNTDRDKFLNSERKKLQLSATEMDDDLNSSRECIVESSVQQAPSLPPSQTNQQQSLIPSSSQASTVTIISQGRTGVTQATGTSTGHSPEVVGQSNISSTDQEQVFLSEELERLSSRGQDMFPNMVVRSSPSAGDAASSSTAPQRMNSESAGGTGGKPSKGKSSSVTLTSLLDYYPKGHVRALTYVQSTTPTKEQKDKSHKIDVASTSQETTSRRKVTKKASQSPRMQRQNETTPSKRSVPRSAERLYSPEEKAVARLLTKLPTTPSKDSSVTTQSVVIDGKNVVVLKHSRRAGTGLQPLSSSSPAKRTERRNIEQVATIPAVGQVNGVQLSELPGQSKSGQPPESNRSGKVPTPASRPHDDERQPNISEEGVKTDGVPQDKATKSAKKGTKRERKDADKTKVAKKTKRSKSKTNKDLGFPVNLDVDKFLSQINYTS
ncbi:protein NPAT-like [Lytechinus variegatus]|uniref:protein NPAT-like n=1 Tax=Lytechinus variegatus TaxID=7654 RepID=UPI001BB0E0C7|nr:protein NPAT-like [Lytechinus variegatus]